MTKELDLMIRKRQNAFIKYGKNSKLYKQLRCKLQKMIKITKTTYYKHKISN